MRVSNRVKQNISGTQFVLGLCLSGVRSSNVVADPSSAKAWVEFIGITISTWVCFDSYSIYRKRVNRGIKFGNRNPHYPSSGVYSESGSDE